jgi:hypothetical protein
MKERKRRDFARHGGKNEGKKKKRFLPDMEERMKERKRRDFCQTWRKE